MPAIHLAKLRHECVLLASHFDQPGQFVRLTHSLLSSYADRTHRTGRSGEPTPLLLAYNVPKPVLRQILIEINPLIISNQQGALDLCDQLWDEPFFEMRYLAVSILGLVSLEPPAPILDRVISWSSSVSDDQLASLIFDLGLDRMRSESPEILIQQISNWLDDADTSNQKLGLQALKPLIAASKYENTPVFFRQLSPYVRQLPPELRNEVRESVYCLAEQSPVETAHFLRQYIGISPDAAWLARQCMRLFPEDIQISLRGLLRSIPSRE